MEGIIPVFCDQRGFRICPDTQGKLREMKSYTGIAGLWLQAFSSDL